MTINSIRKALGLRFYRRVTLIRNPIRVILNLSTRPTLSIGIARWMFNINSRGIDLRTTPATGLQFRKRVAKWPAGNDSQEKILRKGRTK